MVTSEPNIADNARVTKAEACRLLGCSVNTLNRYARYFGIVTHYNKVTLRPVWYGRDIKRLWRCAT